MILKIVSLFFVAHFVLTGFLLSQSKPLKVSLSHPIKFGAENKSLQNKPYINGSDSFKVVAILVQFQEDDDNRTSGNGKFDLSNKYFNPSTGRDTVIDAPPYDSAYFADHLLFLKNYFSKSSKGKANISYDLYGKVITLPNKMEDYSPQRNQSNIKLGNLFQDAWARADSFINFSGYDSLNTAYIIFHAGVGRDVDVSSIFGFDPTPFDIPTVFLGLKNFREFFGSDYNGFLTNEGRYITNSSIIPSTESRELQDLTGSFLYELGVNGIICANFGSYLGLPDLFNTSNGKTAIGRFGLMDGQSIFSYNGIFPPEPSAWEKIFLGWVNPVTVSSGTNTFSIPTSSKNIARDSTIYKVLINSKEYFLIENRNRDPENNGQTIYSRNKNFLDSNTFLQDLRDGFFYTNTDRSLQLLNGNVRDVESFDWSLPGLIDNENNFKGGVLIWHIDENIIESNLASNSINNNMDHKGVDLEEAKGAQEIGITFSTPFQTFTGDGTVVDYWFGGSHVVPSSIYRNAFTPTSNPNSLSYSLTNNNIFITDFSSIDTLMTFRVSIGGSQIKPVSNFPKFIGKDTSGNSQAIAFDFTGNGSEEIFSNSNNRVYGFKGDGSVINGNDSSGLLITGFGKYIPTVHNAGNNNYLVALRDTGIVFKNNNLEQIEFLWNNARSSCPPISIDETDFVYVGRTDGNILKYSVTPPLVIRADSATGSIQQFSRTSRDTFTYITNSNKFLVVGSITSRTSTDVLVVNNSNEFILNGVRLNLNYNVLDLKSSPILADVNSDGRQEIIFVGDKKVYAINSNGVLLDNFPVNFDRLISSGISVADVNNDNIYDLLFASSEGDLFAYGIDGRVVPGFPVKVGPNTISTPAFANLDDTLGIIVTSGDGYLYAFKTNNTYNESKILWKNFLKDKFLSNNNFISGNTPVNISEKLPKDKVYNWPNPVYDNQTFIRYYINGSASTVSIKILDLSGELVTTLAGTAFSRSDNEVKWDVSGVQSGVYYGVIEADIDGAVETKIIKIAVVK